MVKVGFQPLEEIPDELLRYAVVVSRHGDDWVFCKHRARSSWELPGGKREPGEAILDTAARELVEETGALRYEITPLASYSVTGGSQGNSISYGLLCHAELLELGVLPESEIDRIAVRSHMPEPCTHPLIQPLLLEWVIAWRNGQNKT